MAWLLLVPTTLWLVILLLFSRQLRKAWHEPVLRHPVLIIESDDWGPGPGAHAHALRRLIHCLAAFRDKAGRHPVITLGLTLSLPDGTAITESGFADYTPRTFTDPAYADMLETIRAGIRAGVFAPQLHGMAHYWPDALLHAARSDVSIRQWLAQGDDIETEFLPSHLQSRWVDATTLPSSPLQDDAIQAAAREEAVCFAGLFGNSPTVAVPPTFVWTDMVEAAWAAAGVKVVISPGRRFTSRDAAGQPSGVDREIRNGQRGASGIVYLVRDDYFEPKYGHRPEQALAALARKSYLGQPCLLETHRWNFLASTGSDPDVALAALDALYTEALQAHPDLCFVSCEELGRAIRSDDPAWIEQDTRRRFTIWLRRVGTLPRFGKLARLSGLLPLMHLFTRFTPPTS